MINLFPRISIRKGVSYETWGKNATNSALHVEIAEKVEGSWIGILAQEIYESRYKLVWGRFLWMTKKQKAKMEIMGHTIEAVAAKKYNPTEDLHAYMKKEALVLSTMYPELFKGVDTTSIYEQMVASLHDANLWVFRNREVLSHWIEKRLDNMLDKWYTINVR